MKTTTIGAILKDNELKATEYMTFMVSFNKASLNKYFEEVKKVGTLASVLLSYARDKVELRGVY